MEMIKNATGVGIGVAAAAEVKRSHAPTGLSRAFLRWRIRHSERMLNDYTQDLRQAQTQAVRDPSREGSDRAIIEQLEQRIAALKSELG